MDAHVPVTTDGKTFVLCIQGTCTEFQAVHRHGQRSQRIQATDTGTTLEFGSHAICQATYDGRGRVIRMPGVRPQTVEHERVQIVFQPVVQTQGRRSIRQHRRDRGDHDANSEF